MTGTWAVALEKGKSILSWPADADFSRGTVNVMSDDELQERHLVARGFSGQLPRAVLHNGEDDKRYRMKKIDGDLYLVNTKLTGFNLILK